VNFFDAQDKAHRSTRWLVTVYIIATILIVLGVTLVIGVALYLVDDMQSYMSIYDYFLHHPGVFAGIVVVTVLFIVGATIFKASVLSSGGGRVARDLGGTAVAPDVSDPLRRRLRNVVEEMAIASGLPVPEIYVLESESGINAFAAGHAPGDAAIAVTRGTLELLDRNELQGVIGHEFSHVLNGDMRLNIRLMGVLFGIMAIALVGRTILRGVRHARRRYRHRAGSADQGRCLEAARVPGRCVGRTVHSSDNRHRQCAEEDRRLGPALLHHGRRSGRSQPHAVRQRLADERPLCHASAADGPDSGARAELRTRRLPGCKRQHAQGRRAICRS
jgi:Zn-dependent protease with chaperone function